MSDDIHIGDVVALAAWGEDWLYYMAKEMAIFMGLANWAAHQEPLKQNAYVVVGKSVPFTRRHNTGNSVLGIECLVTGRSFVIDEQGVRRIGHISEI